MEKQVVKDLRNNNDSKDFYSRFMHKFPCRSKESGTNTHLHPHPLTVYVNEFLSFPSLSSHMT